MADSGAHRTPLLTAVADTLRRIEAVLDVPPTEEQRAAILDALRTLAGTVLREGPQRISTQSMQAVKPPSR